MPLFKIIEDADNIPLRNGWTVAPKFVSHDRLVDEQGNQVGLDYQGHKYRIIAKHERNFSCTEILGRGFLGSVAVVCSLFLLLFLKPVRDLFKLKKNIRFAILENSVATCKNPEATPEKKRGEIKSTEDFEKKIEDSPGYDISAIINAQPEWMTPDEVVNLVFKKSKTWHIPKFLDEICKKRDYTLSEFDKIRLEIVQNPELTIKELDAQLSEFTTEKKSTCYELADRINHHRIFSDKRFFKTLKSTDLDIARDLMEGPPAKITPQAILNACFNTREYVHEYIEIFFSVYPDFNLTPHDKARKAIVEDCPKWDSSDPFDHKLSNDWIIEEGFKDDAEIYNLAHRLKHPRIFQAPESPVQPANYALNFLWINLNPQPKDASLIFDEKTKEKFAQSLTEWANFHKESTINLWYDSALVTENARKNTNLMLEGIGANLKLKDIRRLPVVATDEIRKSLHPGTPVYFRVDLLKVLIADYQMSVGPKYSIVSDIDIGAQPVDHLFDARTIDYLDKNGYVFNRAGKLNFENSFFIFNREKEGIREIHHETMIKTLQQKIIELPHKNTLTPLDSETIFRLYQEPDSGFLKKANEPGDTFHEGGDDEEDLKPRKVLRTPVSSFALGYFDPKEHQAEQFRFAENSDIPRVKKGRSSSDRTFEPLLKEWKPNPLPDEGLLSP